MVIWVSENLRIGSNLHGHKVVPHIYLLDTKGKISV